MARGVEEEEMLGMSAVATAPGESRSSMSGGSWSSASCVGAACVGRLPIRSAGGAVCVAKASGIAKSGQVA